MDTPKASIVPAIRSAKSNKGFGFLFGFILSLISGKEFVFFRYNAFDLSTKLVFLNPYTLIEQPLKALNFVLKLDLFSLC